MKDKYLIFDTSITTENVGDQIIMDAVNKQVRLLFPNDFVVRSATHDIIGKATFQHNKESKISFVGGTNLLFGRFLPKQMSQWKIGLMDSFKLNDVVFLGVGWGNYQEKHKLFDFLQNVKYRNLSSKKYIHSVRDEYTRQKLAEIGIDSINTADPTMWGFTAEFLSKIPVKKAENVVTTITDYRNDNEFKNSYEKMLQVLLNNYKVVYLWIQSTGDFDLLDSLDVNGKERIELVAPTLSAYNNILKNDSLDYVGTRLHGGIRALQNQKRSIIIEIDNRAREIAKDTNLTTLSMKNIDSLEDMICNDLKMDIQVPFKQINEWKSQFK
ncbi:polysaccharide pyruvyl transferase family protein [Leuconostoc lactis]|uniref:polysaccharide pyruvyl transferase family protein n=1 Tax=Leuconostoc lactis TaxID=1246 RepID=UPI0011BBCBF8|nr:polysaccharide pyruvyl transferase family protein [Leuconostoc lactis]QEA50363.1 polysaccharide pyruvyl transferase family protein [Leuconostoc lactis]